MQTLLNFHINSCFSEKDDQSLNDLSPEILRARMNILNQHKYMSRLCVGCGMCQGICPTSSINFKISEGVITVDFDYSRCTQCGVCIRACPALYNLYREKPEVSDVLGRIEKIYFGYSTDNSIRYHAASGGVITSLVLYMLEQRIVDKVLVTKMDGFTAEPILTGSRNQVLSAQGSIYFKTFSLRIFKRILSDLKEGKRICVVGLPCQISALKKMLEDHQDKLYFLGLICNHTNEFWYLAHTVEKYLPRNAKPLAIGSRKNGWPGEIKVSFKLHSNLGEIAIPYLKFWGILPMLNISSPLGCLLCPDHLANSADIVTADAWHPKFAGKDSSGTSIIIARKPRGLKLIEEAVEDAVLYTEEASLQDLLIASPGLHLIESIHYAPLRRKLFQNRIEVLRELNEIDKYVVLLLTILIMYLLKYRIARQLIVTSRIEKIFILIQWLLSRKKYGKLSQISKNLDLNRRKSIDMMGNQE